MTIKNQEKRLSDPNVDNTASKENKYLLSDESFQLLCDAQQRIADKTEMKPALRKILNKILTKEAIQKVEDELINALS